MAIGHSRMTASALAATKAGRAKAQFVRAAFMSRFTVSMSTWWYCTAYADAPSITMSSSSTVKPPQREAEVDCCESCWLGSELLLPLGPQ